MKHSQEQEALKIWSKHPAREWDEAYPLGNGRMGAMVFGAVQTERFQLNEDSIWYGGPLDRNNRDAGAHLKQIRQLLLEGQIKAAEDLALLALAGTPESQRHYQPLGDLTVHFLNHDHEASHYYRELDLESAISYARYRHKGVAYQREAFISAVDQVLVIRITASEREAISLRSNLKRNRSYERTIAAAPDTILMHGVSGGENGIEFCAAARAVAQGGKVQVLGESLMVDAADTVMLLVSAATSFRHKHPAEECLAKLAEAAEMSFEELKARHLQDYQSLFGRMKLDLSDSIFDPSVSGLTTQERLDRVKTGAEDQGLLRLYFQFGRYLLISSSRPGSLPANLQGIWNQDMLPAWDSKYTININTEMNYWLAETCNLAECHLPLFALIERMREPGRRTAKAMYGCRGFVAHHNTDIWGDTAPQDLYIPATIWPMGAAWLCLHLWEHYAFSGNKDFLHKAYDTMREAAEFFVDFLQEDDKGRLVTSPSVSPENTYILPNGEQGCLCAGPSMDSQIIHALFTACIESAVILQVDEALQEQLAVMLSKLPKPAIGKHGQLQEWAEDYEEAELGHRHISHLFALHPGNQITVKGTPELAAAAQTTLERRLANGGGHTGWSRAWIINFWARLSNGEEAYSNLLELMKHSTLNNLLDNHPPFQIDGNFGAAAGIAEMIVQSHTEEIQILPALPAAWASGRLTGIRARGGFELDVEWKNHKLTQAIIRSVSDSAVSCLVCYKDQSVLLDFAAGKTICLNHTLGIDPNVMARLG